MGLLDKKLRDFLPFSKRSSLENPSAPLSLWFSQMFGGGTSAKININPETAMRFSAVWACVRVLSEGVASLPLHVYKRTSTGKEIAADHPIYALLHHEPNENMTSFTFREVVQAHATLTGNGYAQIIRNQGAMSIGLAPLNPQDMVVKFLDGKYYWFYKNQPINYDDILHLPGLGFNGIVGMSPIKFAKTNIALGIAAEDFGASFFGNGANLSGVLEAPGMLDDKAYNRLKDDWKKKYTGPDNAHETAILEQGLKYTRVGIPPEDAQFIESRKFQVTEIARIFRVPPHMIGDLERATFTNIEQQSIEYVTHTLRPWLVRWEQEINKKLFSTKDKGLYFAEFNIDGLLRGDAAARADYYGKLLNIGVLSQNEIRAMENKNPIEGGDKYFIMSNMIPVEMAGKITNSNGKAA